MYQTGENVIDVMGISKSYFGIKTSVLALSGVSLSVKKGDCFGLLGPNGAGKTTLIKLMLGLFPATRGVIKVFGGDVSMAENRRKLGFLPENHKFPKYLKGWEVLDIYAGFSGVPRRERKKLIPEIADIVGLEDRFMKMKVKKYSKGMQQRLGIAQALIHDPEIIFLDEPTDGVDPVGRKEIRDLLQGVNSRGVTLFINSHLLSEVEAQCKTVAILNRGRLAWQGAINDINSQTFEFSFEVVGMTPEAQQQIVAEYPHSQFFELGFRVTLPTEDHVTRIIDILRSHDVGIRTVIRLKKSLEEFFIESMGEYRVGGA